MLFVSILGIMLSGPLATQLEEGQVIHCLSSVQLPLSSVFMPCYTVLAAMCCAVLFCAVLCSQWKIATIVPITIFNDH